MSNENPPQMNYEAIIELGRVKGVNELLERIVLSLPMLQTDAERTYREMLIGEARRLLTGESSPLK